MAEKIRVNDYVYVPTKGETGRVVKAIPDAPFPIEVMFDDNSWGIFATDEVRLSDKAETVVKLDSCEVVSVTETKPTNPKDSLGVKKAPLHCIPFPPLFEVGLAMLEGGRKYGSHNYRAMGVKSSVYFDAAMRHIASWWEGEDIDSDSGLPHIVKAIACLLVLRDSQLIGNYEDDRPISNKIKMDELGKKVAGLIEKYPSCVPPFTQL
jgi:ribosomal protein L24